MILTETELKQIQEEAKELYQQMPYNDFEIDLVKRVGRNIDQSYIDERRREYCSRIILQREAHIAAVKRERERAKEKEKEYIKWLQEMMRGLNPMASSYEAGLKSAYTNALKHYNQ